MDFHNQQPNVRRRLDFTGVAAGDDDSMSGEGGARNTTLPRDDRVPTPEVVTDSEETDTEISSGEEEGEQVPGFRVLYEGHGRPPRINIPHRGWVTLFVRGLDGFTQILSVPIGRVQLALEDLEELPEGDHHQVQRDD